MNLKEYEAYLGKFLQDYLKKSHCDGYVLGVSGGIDSALVAALLSKYLPKNHHCLIMPILSKDTKDAISVCKSLNNSYKVIDLSYPYNILSGCIEKGLVLSKANLKARLRMSTLYFYAQNRNYLVIGTDNADEYYTGFFTKFGDGGYDINPLVHLTKEEVRKMAKNLGVSDKIINKTPTPGLINGINDEDELRVSYKMIDKFILGKKIPKKDQERIEHLHKVSNHKRALPVFPKPFKR